MRRAKANPRPCPPLQGVGDVLAWWRQMSGPPVTEHLARQSSSQAGRSALPSGRHYGRLLRRYGRGMRLRLSGPRRRASQP